MVIKNKIVLGLWPIAGITTVGVTRDDARATICAAIEGGITAFDTAFSYGFDGESDRLLGQAIAKDRERYTVIGKVGQRWTAAKKRIVDGSPKQLTADAEESLARSGLKYFDTLLLHSPDPNVALEESAGAMQSMRERGLCRRVGFSNMTPDQLGEFAKFTTVDAIECPLNMIQSETYQSLLPAIAEHQTWTCTSTGR